MKNFNCEVERVDDFRVELDANVLTEQWMADFRKDFYDFYTLKEHAAHIAQHRARFGRGFIEGYGIPLENGKKHPLSDEQDTNRAINIVVLNEDCAIDVNTNETK